MIEIQTYQQLGHADHGWLNARHHFSFADYHNPARMGFGILRVINDDIIDAGSGFEMHPHKNMEIITYVRSGAITHKDNQVNEGRIGAGEIQVMSAGTGIYHSEFNRENVKTSLFQIWIKPAQSGITPRWETASITEQLQQNQLNLLVSGNRDAPLFINADAKIYAGHLSAGSSVTQGIEHQAYILVSTGQIEVDGLVMSQGDGAQVTDQSSISINALNSAEIIMLDVSGKSFKSQSM